MNGSSIQSGRAWQMALDQLHLDMPKASFDIWVRDTSFFSFDDRVYSIVTPKAYGREWLSNHLTAAAESHHREAAKRRSHHSEMAKPHHESDFMENSKYRLPAHIQPKDVLVEALFNCLSLLLLITLHKI